MWKEEHATAAGLLHSMTGKSVMLETLAPGLALLVYLA